jgi:hypothetical protein
VDAWKTGENSRKFEDFVYIAGSDGVTSTRGAVSGEAAIRMTVVESLVES